VRLWAGGYKEMIENEFYKKEYEKKLKDRRWAIKIMLMIGGIFMGAVAGWAFYINIILGAGGNIQSVNLLVLKSCFLSGTVGFLNCLLIDNLEDRFFP